MTFQLLAPETEPCVWMRAGQLSYRLCDRACDCEGCPLDAALRGRFHTSSRAPASLGRRTGEDPFPEDRLYSTGHLWVQAAGKPEHRLWRVGLDAFAAALVGCTFQVRWPPSGQELVRGKGMCELDLGMDSLSLTTPISGRLARGNPALREEPRLVVTEPYGRGWLLEVEGLDPGAILGLMPASRVRERTALDLRRFRRALALHLLATEGAPADFAGESLGDLRQALCGSRYIELLAGFVH